MKPRKRENQLLWG